MAEVGPSCTTQDCATDDAYDSDDSFADFWNSAFARDVAEPTFYAASDAAIYERGPDEEQPFTVTRKRRRTHVYTCKQCPPDKPHETSKMVDMQKHVLAAHQGVRLPQCTHPGCTAVFATHRAVRRHALRVHGVSGHGEGDDPSPDGTNEATEHGAEVVRIQPDSQTLVCQHCSTAFGNARALETHVRDTHAPKLIRECPLCPFKTTWAFSFRRHMIECHGHGQHEVACAVCGDLFASKRLAADHAQRVHTATGNGALTRLLQCPLCPYTSRYRSTVLRHVKAVHAEAKGATVDVFSVTPAPVMTTVAVAMATKATTTSTREPGSNIPNSTSGTPGSADDTPMRRCLGSHLSQAAVTRLRRLNTCPFCEFEKPPQSRQAIPAHILNAHAARVPMWTQEEHGVAGIAPVTCNRCPFTTSTLSNMSMHLYVHVIEDAYFVCRPCGFVTDRAHRLEVHKKCHGIHNAGVNTSTASP